MMCRSCWASGAGFRDVLGAVGVGEEPVVADAVEALGEQVHQDNLMNSCG